MMHHLDARTDEDRQQILCTLQRTGVRRPGLSEYPLGVWGVGVDGEAGRDAAEHLPGLPGGRVVRDDRINDGRARVVGSSAQRLGVDDLMHEHVSALRMTDQILRDARIA